MYIPSHFKTDEAAASELLATITVGNLVTATERGPVATLLPLLWAPETGSHDQWRQPALGEAMVILPGPDAYVTPSWYATKADHGRVVPTWNYVTAHVYGRLVVHDDAAWLDAHVRRLTDRQEHGSPHPWSVDDAPPTYVAGQLRAIVGVELVISRIEAKSKLSQNRSVADQDSVRAALATGSPNEQAVAEHMARGPRNRS
jgi:transcriptional regulator